MDEATANAQDTPAVGAVSAASGRRFRPATLISASISLALLASLYRSLDLRLILRALLEADRAWLVVSVGLIVPITVLRAVRFYWVTPPGALSGGMEAFRLTLVASALNVFLPAKAGDLVKSYFVVKRSRTPAGVGLAIPVYERACDLFGLIAWCLFGWALGRPQMDSLGPVFWIALCCAGGASGVIICSERAGALAQRLVERALAPTGLRRIRELAEGWPALLQSLRGRRLRVVSFSLALWLLHLFQLWLFTVALSLNIPFTVSASLSAVALMAGQLPFTLAGLGATDVALVALLAAYTTPERAAAMAVLISTRGLLPPLLALPIMRPYLAAAVADARAWRQRTSP